MPCPSPERRAQRTLAEKEGVFEGGFRRVDLKRKIETRMEKKTYTTWRDTAFFKDQSGWIKYNKLCEGCSGDCKQSFRVTVVACPRYRPAPKK